MLRWRVGGLGRGVAYARSDAATHRARSNPGAWASLFAGIAVVIGGRRLPIETFGVLLSVLTPLVVVPLTVIMFYLRSAREHELARHQEISTRVDECGRALDALRVRFGDFERDYATKEEWLRECLHARSALERLSAATARLEAVVEARCAWLGVTGSSSKGSSGDGGTVDVPREDVKEVT